MRCAMIEFQVCEPGQTIRFENPNAGPGAIRQFCVCRRLRLTIRAGAAGIFGARGNDHAVKTGELCWNLGDAA